MLVSVDVDVVLVIVVVVRAGVVRSRLVCWPCACCMVWLCYAVGGGTTEPHTQGTGRDPPRCPSRLTRGLPKDPWLLLSENCYGLRAKINYN